MRVWICNYCNWNGDQPETMSTHLYIGCEEDELAEDETPVVEVCPKCNELVVNEAL